MLRASVGVGRRGIWVVIAEFHVQGASPTLSTGERKSSLLEHLLRAWLEGRVVEGRRGIALFCWRSESEAFWRGSLCEWRRMVGQHLQDSELWLVSGVTQQQKKGGHQDYSDQKGK